jgi:catechol 2,3-dioxygenase-like lactoylglutathione lyase family enzyme
MTIQRMDHVGVVVDDLEAATAFFVELGMELEGETPVEGRWVDRVVGLDDVRVDIAMMRTPDGHGRLELTKFHTPTALSAEPENAPANALGIRRIMFAVEDIEDVLARLHNARRRPRWRAGAERGQQPKPPNRPRQDHHEPADLGNNLMQPYCA